MRGRRSPDPMGRRPPFGGPRGAPVYGGPRGGGYPPMAGPRGGIYPPQQQQPPHEQRWMPARGGGPPYPPPPAFRGRHGPPGEEMRRRGPAVAPILNAVAAADPVTAPVDATDGTKPVIHPVTRAGRFEHQRTLVVDHIPQSHYHMDQVTDYFKRFGHIISVTLMPHSDRALVSFASNAEAVKAFRSPDPIFDNRFVKVFWHKPAGDAIMPPHAQQHPLPLQQHRIPYLQPRGMDGPPAAPPNGPAMKADAPPFRPSHALPIRKPHMQQHFSIAAAAPNTDTSTTPVATRTTPTTATAGKVTQVARLRDLQRAKLDVARKELMLLFEKKKNMSDSDRNAMQAQLRSVESSLADLDRMVVTEKPIAPAPHPHPRKQAPRVFRGNHKYVANRVVRDDVKVVTQPIRIIVHDLPEKLEDAQGLVSRHFEVYTPSHFSL